ncbi:sortase [Actinokineospora soli]|uniref:Sortase n=1 Tax=Actinokineospora soli TaxID=1048753 RepID=A0ABW2TJP5_9PSEU
MAVVAPQRVGAHLAGQMLAILGAVLLCFAAHVAVFGAIAHERDQQRAYDALRTELANGTAPVSALDEEGRLLAAGTPLAVLEIPRLGVREVVLEGTSAGTTASGVGHLRTTPMPGQRGTSVLFGRNAAYGAPFGTIDELRAGDRITVTTGQGVHEYSVTGVRRAGDEYRPKPAGLTLTTADGPAFLPTDVLRVDAALTSDPVPGDGPAPRFAVPDEERVMAGDLTALVPLTVWFLALAVVAVALVALRDRLGRGRAWVIGAPVVIALGMTAADTAAALLPNLM